MFDSWNKNIIIFPSKIYCIISWKLLMWKFKAKYRNYFMQFALLDANYLNARSTKDIYPGMCYCFSISWCHFEWWCMCQFWVQPKNKHQRILIHKLTQNMACKVMTACHMLVDQVSDTAFLYQRKYSICWSQCFSKILNRIM